MKNLYIAYVIALGTTFGAMQYGSTISGYVSKGWDKTVNAVATAVAVRLPENNTSSSPTMRRAGTHQDTSKTPSDVGKPQGSAPVGGLAVPFAIMLAGYGTTLVYKKKRL